MKTDRFTVISIKTERRFGKFPLCKVVREAIRSNHEELKNGDILVVSSKFAAMAEGRYVRLADVKASAKAKKFATRFSLDPSLAELILRESDAILGGITGFALAVSKGVLSPNGGIDRSNIPHGFAILYPENPQKTARMLRKCLEKHSGERSRYRKGIGVILSDSRITPTRAGTIGIAIATSGFKPVIDFRGQKDLFGNELKVTLKAVADELCSAAQLVMGEARESTPIAIVRGYVADHVEDGALPMVVPYDQCLYIEGLRNQL